jgi:hypothetical protein
MINKNLKIFFLLSSISHSVSAGIFTHQEVAEDKLAITAYSNMSLLSVTKENIADGKAVFGNLSPMISKDSIHFSTPVESFTFSNNNFNYTQILTRNLGESIRVSDDTEMLGKGWHTATLLSADINPIVRYRDGSIKRLSDTDRIYLSKPPLTPGLPSVKVLLDDSEDEVTMTYITSGLSWKPTYTLDLVGNKVSFTAMASVSNSTGADFTNASISFVSGSKRQNSRSPIYVNRTIAKFSKMAESLPPKSERGKYYFNLDKKVDLFSGETKSFPLLTQTNIDYTSTYSIQQSLPVRNKNIHATSFLNIENSKDNIGSMLPAGSANIYSTSSDNKKVYLGTSFIDDTNINQNIKLNIGEDLDIFANFKTTNSRTSKILTNGKPIIEYIQNIKLFNNKKSPIKLSLKFNKPHNLYKHDIEFISGSQKIPLIIEDGKLILNITIRQGSFIDGMIKVQTIR